MENKNRISLVFITDKNYLIQTWVAVRSLIESQNTNTNTDIYIISDGLSDLDKQKMFSVLEGYHSCELIFLDVDSTKDFSGKIPDDILKSWAPAVLYKLLLCDILPLNVHKVIYLDGDMIIRKDLSYLYNIDLESNYVGAVRDTFYDNIGHEKRMNMEGEYFNTGCLLLNLDFMREVNLSRKLIDTKMSRPEFGLADQDTYNEVCRGKVKLLSCRYNFYTTSFLMNEDMNGFKKYTVCPYDDRKTMIEDVAVIHMIHYRPWRLKLSDSQWKAIDKITIPNIYDGVISYILLKWISLYKESPFYKDLGYESFKSETSISLSPCGLISYEKFGPIRYKISQDCVKGIINVSLNLGGINLVTKRTNPILHKRNYSFIR